MKASFVSKNAHKARELAALLPGWEVVATVAAELPEEVGRTFYENALGKAAFDRNPNNARVQNGYLGMQAPAVTFGRTVDPPDRLVIGEDSGLEVDGLGGCPGIYSARYAGPGATDEENVARLLGELQGVTGEGRRGRYVSELVALAPDGREARGTGTLEGSIAEVPRGSEGFGYDPVFIPAGETSTVAELGNEWKALRSHRAGAAAKLREAVGSGAFGL